MPATSPTAPFKEIIKSPSFEPRTFYEPYKFFCSFFVFLFDYNVFMTSFIMNIDSKYFVSVTLEMFDPASSSDGVDVFRAFVVDNNSGKDLAEVFFECGVECEFWDIVNVFSDVFKEFMKSEVK